VARFEVVRSQQAGALMLLDEFKTTALDLGGKNEFM
jgi:hypothetical protein